MAQGAFFEGIDAPRTKRFIGLALALGLLALVQPVRILAADRGDSMGQSFDQTIEANAQQLVQQGQQIFRFDTGGWGTVTYWNAIVAVNELHGVGTFFDERLDDAAQFPMPPPPRRATSPRIRRMIRSPASSLRCTSISWRCRPCSRAPEQTSIRRRPLAVTRCSAARPIATMVS